MNKRTHEMRHAMDFSFGWLFIRYFFAVSHQFLLLLLSFCAFYLMFSVFSVFALRGFQYEQQTTIFHVLFILEMLCSIVCLLLSPFRVMETILQKLKPFHMRSTLIRMSCHCKWLHMFSRNRNEQQHKIGATKTNAAHSQ